MDRTKVIVIGATGNMGKEVVKAVLGEKDLELVGAVDINSVGQDLGETIGLSTIGVKISSCLETLCKEVKPEVMVDFTNPQSVKKNIITAISLGVFPVVGTTGINENDLLEIKKLCDAKKMNAIIAPNFAIGAILMMRFAQVAAKYLPHVEIIELHHPRKIDAPSGTAIKTAEMVLQERGEFQQGHPEEYEKFPGPRGGNMGGIHVHSVRLPGLIAHQEVLFGGLGQLLTIKHDSFNRESFMPGVLMAIRKVKEITGVVYGLENLID